MLFEDGHVTWVELGPPGYTLEDLDAVNQESGKWEILYSLASEQA